MNIRATVIGSFFYALKRSDIFFKKGLDFF